MGLLDAPSAPWPTKDFLRRLIERDTKAADVWRARSSALSSGAWTSKTATEFLESWNTAPTVAGDTRWSPYTAGKLQAYQGYLAGTATSDGTSGLNHALSLQPNQSATIYTTVNVTSAGAGGNLLIGITSDSAGGAFTSGGNTLKGLSFHTSASGVTKYDNGTETSSSNTTAYVAGVYSVTLRITPTYYSIVAVSPDGTQEYRAQWARGSVTPNNFAVYNGNTSQNKLIGPVAVVYGPALASPSPMPTAIGGGALGSHHHTLWQDLPGGMLRVMVPPTWDSRAPSPWVLMWHGHGSNETHWADNADGKVVANALVAAGFVVIGFAGTSTTPWGAQTEMSAAAQAIAAARDGMNLGVGGFYCNSMGSIDGLNAIRQRIVPGVQFYIGTSPTFSLLANYDNAGQTFTASINTAYGITSGTLSSAWSSGTPNQVQSSVSFASGTKVLIDYANATPGTYEQATVQSVSGSGPYTLTLTANLNGPHASGATISNYPDKTAGRDPSLAAPEEFLGVPYLVLNATDDTTVDPTKNGNLIPALLNAYAPIGLINSANAGGHSFDFTPYTLRTSKYDIVNFAVACTGNP